MWPVILASALLLLSTSSANAEFISLGIALAVGLSGPAATIGAAVITTALTVAASYGLTLIANQLRSSSNTDSVDPAEVTPSAAGNDLNTQYGGDIPRQAIFGLGATAGHLVYANVYSQPDNPPNTTLQAVFVLGDGLHDGISRLWYNGKLVTVSSSAVGTAIEIPEFARSSDGGICVHIKFFDGRFDQSADPELGDGANPPDRWTADHVGHGICYIVVTQLFSEELELTGMPQLLVELRGLKLYDPRFDDTAGGSGSHRWGQPDTYAWTDNPAIIEYNYRRGIYIGADLILGMGVSSSDLILPMYMSAANVCDEAVATLEGPTEKRYRCGFTASTDHPHSDAITTVRDAMAGYSLERAGQFAPIPGVNQLTLFTFTDDDLEVGKDFSYSKYKTRSAISTAVYGSFSDPEQLWGSVPFPARIDPVDDALTGERLGRSVDLTQVFSHSQAQRIAEIERRRSMLQPNGTCTLPAKFFGIQPGDWGTYNSARYGSFSIVAKGVTINQDHSITLNWDRIEAHVFSWTTAGEENRPAIPTGGEGGQRVNIVTGFAAVGIDISGADGVKHPAFQVLWDPITDPTIDAVIIEFRVAALAGDWEETLFTAPAQGFGQLSAGIQGNTVYELRALLLVSPYRPTGIAGPVSALSGNHVVQSALNFPPDLPAFIAGKVSAIFADALNTQRQILDFLAAHTADVDAQQILERARVKRDVGTIISDVVTNFETSERMATARAYVETTAETSAEEAIATFSTELETTYVTTDGTATSSADLILVALSQHDRSDAAFDVTLDAQYVTTPAGVAHSTAQILASAHADTTTAITTYDQSIAAAIGVPGATIYSTVTTHQSAIVTLNGMAAAQYAVTLDVNGYAVGFQILNAGTPALNTFTIVSNKFQIAQPGVGGGDAVPVFAIQSTPAGTKLAFRGDMFADGTIYATQLIANNVVVTGHLQNNTATSVQSAQGGGVSVSPGSAATLLNLPITVKGGKLVIFASVDMDNRTGEQEYSGGNIDAASMDTSVDVYIQDSVGNVLLLRTIVCPAEFWFLGSTRDSNNFVKSTGAARRVAGHFPTIIEVSGASAGNYGLLLNINVPSFWSGVGFSTGISNLVCLESTR